MTDKKENTKTDKVDEELSNLLDSALEDFTKIDDAKKEDRNEETDKVSISNSASPNAQEWSNDFIQQAANQFEENFGNLIVGADPNAQLTPEFIQQKLQQMADAAQQVLENPTNVPGAPTDLAASISQAIQGLNAGAEDLQAPLNEEELLKMLSSGGGMGSENDLLPFMQGMMQGLLSKEVLGPSLQDFVEKLPGYIEKNRATLAKEDIETHYENQKKLMDEVLEELNKEKNTDPTEVKTERFSTVLGLMQKLQDYGQPPAELVGDLDAPFNFDPQGNPINLANNQVGNPECSLM